MRCHHAPCRVPYRKPPRICVQRHANGTLGLFSARPHPIRIPAPDLPFCCLTPSFTAKRISNSRGETRQTAELPRNIQKRPGESPVPTAPTSLGYPREGPQAFQERPARPLATPPKASNLLNALRAHDFYLRFLRCEIAPGMLRNNAENIAIEPQFTRMGPPGGPKTVL
eukprot:3900073-Pyramimonas_sp.AAC.2